MYTNTCTSETQEVTIGYLHLTHVIEPFSLILKWSPDDVGQNSLINNLINV